MQLIQRLDADRRAIDLALRLRRRHGRGPLLLRVPGRQIALVLDPEDAYRITADSPDPFTPANAEKRAALSQFQPHGVLISDTAQRPQRRAINEAVLEPGEQIHRLATPFAEVVAQEIARLTEHATELDWPSFEQAWWRIVRRIALGDDAREDTAVIDALSSLRRTANWASFAPLRSRARRRFDERLARHLSPPRHDSLAGLLAEQPDDGADPYGQLPHWLFAFDAAGIVTFRTLALLATYPEAAARARQEASDAPSVLPFLRGCVLETVRLWPTTPAILRDSTSQTQWDGETIAAGTAFVIYTPALHRDPALPFADRFEPDIWLDGTAKHFPALLPFSGGPAICPGRNLVQFVATTALARLLAAGSYELASGPELTDPLPATLDNFHLRLKLERP